MQILTEIIEISNQMVDTLDENGFFYEHIFLERVPLKIALQEKMQRKWEQENEMILTDGEFLQVCNEVNADSIAKTIADLVEKGAVNVSINESGEIIYSANKAFNTDEL
jgi:hypothetical protein